MPRRRTAWGLAACLLATIPAGAQPAGESREQAMDRLFGMLKVAPNEQAAEAVENAIDAQWLGQATPAVKLLLLRGMRELNDGHAPDALEDFDAALDLQPDLVQAWRGRALARARLGDSKGAEHDVAETIKREPRQFQSLQDLSRIAESAGDWKGAYAAWSRVMALDPMTSGGADRLKDLKRRALGDDT